MWYVKQKNLSIGIIIMTEEGENYIIHGRRTREIVSNEVFSKDNILNIEGFSFKASPMEVLHLEAKHSKSEADRELGKKLITNNELLKKIEFIKLD